jgi:RNA polymerase sigma factor for flagellar operon FliA
MEAQLIATSKSSNKAALLPALPRQRRTSPRPLPMARVPALEQKGGRLAEERQRLLVEMFPLVKRLAFKIREHLPAHVEVDDLIANGMLGLVDAISKFDITKRVKLESYARHRVRGSILDGLRSVDPASRDLRRKNKKIQKVYRELEIKLGRRVADEEIAEALALSLQQWHATLNEIQTLGMDFGARKISAGPNMKRPSAEPELLTRDEDNPFDLCYQREKREILGRALAHLREREREIISLYYYQELTMKQIADRMNIDESRVSQLHSAAIARLKASVNSNTPRRANNKPAVPSVKSMSVGAGA